MSAKKETIEFNEEEKVTINEKNNSQIIRYSKNFAKNLRFENIKKSTNKNNEIEKNNDQNNDIDKIKQKLMENLDSNLNSYILSTKAKEQKIFELLEIINQYESQITLLNNQIIKLTNSNKQMKEILKKIEFNYEQNKIELKTEKEKAKNNSVYLNNLQKEKIISEKKIEELVNIINQYSTQIEALTGTLNNLKIEFFDYKNKNEQDKNKLIELNNINNKLKKENDLINENFNKLKMDFIKLKQDKENLEKKYIDLDKNNNVIITEKENLENLLEKEKVKSTDLIYYINEDLKSLVEYFDNKFNSIINQENNNTINENKLSLNCFKNIEDDNEIKNINLQMFIKTIINGINSIKEKMNKDNENYQKLIKKEKKYIQDINELKEKIINNEKLINQNDHSNDYLIMEKNYSSIKNEIKIKEVQIENINKLIKIKDDTILKLKEDIKKLISDNIKLIKEFDKKYEHN